MTEWTRTILVTKKRKELAMRFPQDILDQAVVRMQNIITNYSRVCGLIHIFCMHALSKLTRYQEAEYTVIYINKISLCFISEAAVTSYTFILHLLYGIRYTLSTGYL